MAEKPNLYQRMNAVSAAAGKIPKRGYNDYAKYKYVMAVDVINHVAKLLHENGINLTITDENIFREQHGKNFHTVIESTAHFVNTDDRDDRMSVKFFGVAADTLDKDLYKAKTNGLKYLFTQQFLIVTDNVIDVEVSKDEAKREAAKEPENPGFDDGPDEEAPVSKDQIAALTKLCQTFNWHPDRTLEAHGNEGFQSCQHRILASFEV
jgi:hypothetical protein